MISLKDLLADIRQCDICKEHLPLGANPVLRATETAKILIVGQAPGTRVHATGIPWNDPSGDRLRMWLDLDREQFYDESNIAIIPVGLCYPGKGKSGDLPPRPECAPKWHPLLRPLMPNIQFTLLVGQYAQQYYLQDQHRTLTARVSHWQQCLPDYLPLPHPSPRNTLWLRKNPWFEADVVPFLQSHIRKILL
ncbi:uracil-DNA glycosylase family protein [Zooshikella marina]|uniref:uracil-DNA glycosylase family protein n=1 Tax=Zooshikella ganghwensis TaxID=202772 RepID=UPI001BAF7474|nr:uracil-DNA glycosylase family protein [Zooshikella ganghwensis]MBU2705515.1 uracil-DNA glycosylase family protein [Zooshikella ganghwensis]